jgi:peptide subunit release factor 1 (eRF1)
VNDLSYRTLSRIEAMEFVEKLEHIHDIGWSSIYIASGLSSTEIMKVMKSLNLNTETQDSIFRIIIHSKIGAAVFRSNLCKYIFFPPFPIRETVTLDTLHTKPILSLLQTDHKIALILVRLGSYSIGVCQGEKLINSRVGTGLIHGRHKKGGSSAHRFERHRAKQIEYFLARVCQHTREQLEPHRNSLDYLIYGGARTTIQLLQKQCPFTGKLEAVILPPILDIPEPRQVVLEKTIGRVWSSTVIEWNDD